MWSGWNLVEGSSIRGYPFFCEYHDIGSKLSLSFCCLSSPRLFGHCHYNFRVSYICQSFLCRYFLSILALRSPRIILTSFAGIWIICWFQLAIKVVFYVILLFFCWGIINICYIILVFIRSIYNLSLISLKHVICSLIFLLTINAVWHFLLPDSFLLLKIVYVPISLMLFPRQFNFLYRKNS